MKQNNFYRLTNEENQGLSHPIQNYNELSIKFDFFERIPKKGF